MRGLVGFGRKMDGLQNRDVRTENIGRTFRYSIRDSPSIATAMDVTLSAMLKEF